MTIAGRAHAQARGFTATIAVEIRPCAAADLEALEWFGAFTHHRAIIREAYEAQQAGHAIMLLAITGGFPVGQAWLDLRLDPPMVWAVRVIDPLRGLGIGERLMAALEARAVQGGERRLQVGVETHNPAALRFYERLGWRVVGEQAGGYGYAMPDGTAVRHALHEWVLHKELG